MKPITLTVPMPPNLANPASRKSRHYVTIHLQRKAYVGQLDLLRAARMIPAPPATPLAKAHIRSTMYLGGAMDDDNAMARHKWVLDWLVRRGYLIDDRKKYLQWEGFPTQIIKRDGNYRLELTLTPID